MTQPNEEGEFIVIPQSKKKWPWRTLLLALLIGAAIVGLAWLIWWYFFDEDDNAVAPVATPAAIATLTPTPQPTATQLPTVAPTQAPVVEETPTPIEVKPGVFMLPRRYAEQGILRAPHWPATDSKGGDA